MSLVLLFSQISIFTSFKQYKASQNQDIHLIFIIQHKFPSVDFSAIWYCQYPHKKFSTSSSKRWRIRNPNLISLIIYSISNESVQKRYPYLIRLANIHLFHEYFILFHIAHFAGQKYGVKKYCSIIISHYIHKSIQTYIWDEKIGNFYIRI